jgi:hypothetical protein
MQYVISITYFESTLQSFTGTPELGLSWDGSVSSTKWKKYLFTGTTEVCMRV